MKLNTRNLWFVTGAKGGVGKSFFLKMLTNYLRNKEFSVKLYDCDDSTLSLKKAFDDAIAFSVRDQKSLEQMLENVLEGDDDFTLIDFPAASSHDVIPMFRVLLEDAAVELEEAGLKISTCALLANEPDSIFSVAQWVVELEDRVQWIFVKNEIRGPVENVLNSKDGKRIVEACQPIQVSMHKLEPDYLAEALRNHNLTVTDVIEGRGPVDFQKVMTKSRCRRYFREFSENMDKLLPVMVEFVGEELVS